MSYASAGIVKPFDRLQLGSQDTDRGRPRTTLYWLLHGETISELWVPPGPPAV